MNLKKPLISVIVPVYNVEKYIKKCAKSLLAQTYKNCELIFINDGTKDNSIEKLKELKDKRIKIINQKNQGVSSARNNGLKHANGKYVIFVDGDDYVAKDYVEYLYNLINHENADFAYTTNIYKSKYDKQIERDYINIVDRNKSTGILLNPDVVVGSYNKIYKKSIINKNNLTFRTDLYYGEGLNFIIRMSLCSSKIAIGKKKIYYYRKNNTTSATTKYNNDKYHNGLKSLEIIKNIINFNNEYVKSMYIIHISTFYLGAITQMIENKQIIKYNNDYKMWKKQLKSNVKYIVKNKYISNYRKCMILIGANFPHLIAYIDQKRQKKIKKNSVN